ncbi:MAG: hypothetical protein ABJG33_00225 [Balneola sp.]
MKKYLIKKNNHIVFVQEDWKQSIIADTYTYLGILLLATLLYFYTVKFGRSWIFELAFVVMIVLKLLASYSSKTKIIEKEEAIEALENFFEEEA